MNSQGNRSRSNNSVSSTTRGPKSRASTASAQSSSTQPIQQYSQRPEDVEPFDAQPLSLTAEEMITRSERQLTNPNQTFVIDPSLQDQTDHQRAQSEDFSLGGNVPLDRSSVARPSINQYHSFDGRENQIVENSNEEQPQDDTGPGEGIKKKGSASSIANDKELRRLFRENQGRSLKDVAAHVLDNDRGPKSEKNKQIFAMLWLYAVCKKSSSSVPRNRVYSHYATRCGTERVPPLNPASFGKLVRIIFPGIQTRRLGMRGESKYHYVDLSLIEDDQPTDTFNKVQQNMDVGSMPADRPIRIPQSQVHADTAVFPSPDNPFTSNPFSSASGIDRSINLAPADLYLNRAAHNILQAPSNSNMARRELKFSRNDDLSYFEQEPIDLPSINKYLPVGTDIDSADALTALYRSHCISVIDCFRFCKDKMLLYHFTSFHGTLTVPSQKLFAHPNISPWIKECDWLMYQKMLRFVAPLALQVVPNKVIVTFRTISDKLGQHISNTFQNLPQHVRDAKLGPAVIFAGLIDRILRVNATAHAAANILTNDANRDQMWHDWVLNVKPTKVVESSLPGCGYTRVLQILTTDIRDLLGPLKTTAYAGMDPIFALASYSGLTSMSSQHAHPETENHTTEGVLDRWTIFLQNLPLRFPAADARLLLHCVGEAGSAALRDITIAQSLSFGSWWITKVWVDEMLLWLAEKGGFMEGSPTGIKMRGKDNFLSDDDFPMDEGSDLLAASRPRTAVSESVDAHTRFGSADVGSIYHRQHSRAVSLSHQQNKHSEYPVSKNFDGHYAQGPFSRHHSIPSAVPPSNPTHEQQIHGLGIMHSQFNQQFGRASSTHAPSQVQATDTQKPIEMPAEIQRVVDMQNVQTHEDSGIGMGLEDEDLTMAKFGGFVGSDPADVVVC